MYKFETAFTWIKPSGEARRVASAEFHELCLRFARLHARDEPQEVCIIWEPSVEAIACFVGAMMAGHVPAFFSVPNQRLNSEYYQRQLHALKSRKRRLIGSPQYVELGLDDTLDISGVSPLPPPTTFSADFIQFSSGTTGMRKAIAYRGEICALHNRDYASCLGMDDEEVIISWLPHYHDMGLIACTLLPLQLGYDVVHMSNLSWVANPNLLVEGALKFGASLCWQPNFAFQLMVERSAPTDLSGLRFVSCAEPVFERPSTEFESKFKTSVRGCYAMAETVFAVTQSSTRSSYRGIRSSGVPLRGTEVRIQSEEIQIRSPYLLDRYLTGEACRFDDGWYCTGDRGVIVDGELFVLGRIDDSFKVRGVLIVPEIVEARANEIAGVDSGRVACIEISSQDGSSTAALLFEGSISERDALSYMSSEGIEMCVQVPSGWLVKSSSGKISRKSCREHFMRDLFGKG